MFIYYNSKKNNQKREKYIGKIYSVSVIFNELLPQYKDKLQVGVSAQQIKEVPPEVIQDAPIDSQYMSVQYDKIVPLLIEAIKELKKEIESLKS